jgi:hypothetical protein
MTAVFRYPEGFQATFQATFANQRPGKRDEFFGKDGTIVITSERQLTFYPEPTARRQPEEMALCNKAFSQKPPAQLHIENFFECNRERRPTRCRPRTATPVQPADIWQIWPFRNSAPSTGTRSAAPWLSRKAQSGRVAVKSHSGMAHMDQTRMMPHRHLSKSRGIARHRDASSRPCPIAAGRGRLQPHDFSNGGWRPGRSGRAVRNWPLPSV